MAIVVLLSAANGWAQDKVQTDFTGQQSDARSSPAKVTTEAAGVLVSKGSGVSKLAAWPATQCRGYTAALVKAAEAGRRHRPLHKRRRETRVGYENRENKAALRRKRKRAGDAPGHERPGNALRQAIARVVFVVDNLLNGAPRADAKGFQFDLHDRDTVDEQNDIVTVMAVVGVDAELVDDFKVFLHQSLMLTKV